MARRAFFARRRELVREPVGVDSADRSEPPKNFRSFPKLFYAGIERFINRSSRRLTAESIGSCLSGPISKSASFAFAVPANDRCGHKIFRINKSLNPERSQLSNRPAAILRSAIRRGSRIWPIPGFGMRINTMNRIHNSRRNLSRLSRLS